MEETETQISIKKTKGCKNCEGVLLPEYNYCPHCGQSVKIKRLNLKQVRSFYHINQGRHPIKCLTQVFRWHQRLLNT